jgi:hypothetical protein
MPDSIFAIVVSGIEMPAFLSLLPPLKAIGSSSSSPWPDCDDSSIAVAEHKGFILSSGNLFELIGEGVACEASRPSPALYLSESYQEDRYYAVKFERRRPTARVEALEGRIVEDSMSAFAGDTTEKDDKNYGRVDTYDLLSKFIGDLPTLEWTHYETPQIGQSADDDLC